VPSGERVNTCPRSASLRGQGKRRKRHHLPAFVQVPLVSGACQPEGEARSHDSTSAIVGLAPMAASGFVGRHVELVILAERFAAAEMGYPQWSTYLLRALSGRSRSRPDPNRPGLNRPDPNRLGLIRLGRSCASRSCPSQSCLRRSYQGRSCPSRRIRCSIRCSRIPTRGSDCWAEAEARPVTG
jgi:hypothetical protein